MKKTLAPILIFIVVGILITSVFILGKKAPTSNSTANWKTYTNAQYGFSFKYPPTLYFEDDSKIRGDGQFGFYKVGIKADPSYGEHVGNEVLIHSIINVEDINGEENLFKESKESVEGHPLLRNIYGENNIEILLNKKMIFIEQEQLAGTKNYIDTVLSTFKFTN